MKSNHSYYPCQVEDGRTFVMKGSRIVEELSGFDTTERWRDAQRIANDLNTLAGAGLSRRDRLAILFAVIMAIAIALFAWLIP